MPVTVRLLQRLQETLGDEATVDLVAWLNEAAGMSREAMRGVADLYFVRFDARLEQGLIKWMFIFWVGTIVPLAGLIITLNRR